MGGKLRSRKVLLFLAAALVLAIGFGAGIIAANRSASASYVRDLLPYGSRLRVRVFNAPDVVRVSGGRHVGWASAIRVLSFQVRGLSRQQIIDLLERRIRADDGWTISAKPNQGVMWFQAHKGTGKLPDDPSVTVLGPTEMAESQGKEGPVVILESLPISRIQALLFRLQHLGR